MSYKSIVLAAIFMGLGCTNPAPKQNKKEVAPVAPVNASAAPEAKAEAKPAATVSPANTTAKVSLVEAGAAPLAKLRLVPKKGDKIAAEMSMNMGMEMTINGMTMPSPKTPTIRMFMDIEIAELTPENDIRYNFVFTKVTIDQSPETTQQMIDALEKNLKTMEGLSGYSIVDNRGFTKQAEFKIPDSVAPNMKQTLDGMRQSLNQLSAPLPEEAVGVGAKWKVDQSVASNGINIQQTATYSLLSVDGNNIKLGVLMQQSAPAQDVSGPGMPSGAKVRLTSLDSKGEGELQMSLEKLMPSVGTLGLISDFKMSTSEGGAPQEMSMKMTMKMGISSK